MLYSLAIYFVSYPVTFTVFLKADEIMSLKEQLMKKDADMRHMEERYKKYLDKAKQVGVCLFNSLQ